MKSADGPVDRGDEQRDGLADTPADSNGATAGPAAARQRTSWVQRLLDNKTSLQRIVISLGALAAALLAIGVSSRQWCSSSGTTRRAQPQRCAWRDTAHRERHGRSQRFRS
jgi:hypothetical protein